MNNETIHSYSIKRRKDKVYDIYVDKKHIVSKGSIASVLEALRKIMEEDYD